MTPMHIRRTFSGNRTSIVEVMGDLVGSSGNTLRHWLERMAREHPQGHIHLDMHRVGEVEAAACDPLAELAHRLRRAGGGLLVSGAPEAVRQALARAC